MPYAAIRILDLMCPDRGILSAPRRFSLALAVEQSETAISKREARGQQQGIDGRATAAARGMHSRDHYT